jgi:F-type H+-transporting ATPase subunit delta
VVHEQLADFVASLDEVPDLSALLANQETESRVKADVIERVLGNSDELVRNFVRLLIEKGRATEVREIAREFDALVHAEDKVLDVDLTTAHELSKDEFERILGLIEKASGRKVQATRSVDEDLIGGIVLQAGSMRLDASVRGRLERLRHQLATTRS